jgi:hypothetical protein
MFGSVFESETGDSIASLPVGVPAQSFDHPAQDTITARAAAFGCPVKNCERKQTVTR